MEELPLTLIVGDVVKLTFKVSIALYVIIITRLCVRLELRPVNNAILGAGVWRPASGIVDSPARLFQVLVDQICCFRQRGK